MFFTTCNGRTGPETDLGSSTFHLNMGKYFESKSNMGDVINKTWLISTTQSSQSKSKIAEEDISEPGELLLVSLLSFQRV